MRAANHRGFTLLEILITMGIVGILSALAVPSYQQVIQRVRRQEAQLALLRIQGLQERHFAHYLRYATRLTAPADAEGLGLSSSSDGGNYELSIEVNDDGLGYTALAQARGRQSHDQNCAVLTLNQTGQRGSADALGNSSQSDSGLCWK